MMSRTIQYFTAAAIMQITSDFAYPSDYSLLPGRGGFDGARGDVRILLSSPQGWEGPASPVYDFEVGFVLKNNSYPFLAATAQHIGRYDPWLDRSKVSAKTSYIVANLKHDGEITEFKAVGSFDAGANGKLTIWRIRSEGDDYYLVLIVQKQTEVDIYLRGHDADELKPYLKSLKEVARSVRFVNS